MKIIITQSKEGSWNVATDEDKEATELGYDEAIGTIASLIMQQELLQKNELKCLKWITFEEYHHFQRLTWDDKYKPLINKYFTNYNKEGKIDTPVVKLFNNDYACLTVYNNALMVKGSAGNLFHIDRLSEGEIEAFINIM